MNNKSHSIEDAPHFLREDELAKRWRLSRRWLQRRRKDGTGPAWLTLGNRIVYAIDDVREYEHRARSGRDRDAK